MSQKETFEWGDGTSLEVSADSFSGNQSLTLNTGSNSSAENRSRSLSITTADQSASAVLLVTQAASVFTYTFTLQPQGEVQLSAAGGTLVVGNELVIFRNGEELSRQQNVDCTYTLFPSQGVSIEQADGLCTLTFASRGTTLGLLQQYQLTGSFQSAELEEAVEATLSLSQEENLIEEVQVDKGDSALTYNVVSAAGGSGDPIFSSVPVVSAVFTSGASAPFSSLGLTEDQGTLTAGFGSWQMEPAATFTAIDSASGVVTVASRESALGDVLTSLPITCSYTASWAHSEALGGAVVEGTPAEYSATITQSANVVTDVSVESGLSGLSIQYPEVPASGGSVNPVLSVPETYSVSYTWSSGATSTELPTEGSLSFKVSSFSGSSSDGFSMDDASFPLEGTVIVASREGVLGAARQSSEITAESIIATVLWESADFAPEVSTASLGDLTCTVTQAQNIIESYSIRGDSWTSDPVQSFTAAGGSASYTNLCTFSSGYEGEYTDTASISWTLDGDFGVLETPQLLDITDWMCTVIAASRTTVVGESLSASLVLRIAGSAQAEATLALTQARNNVVSAVCCTPEGEILDSVVGPLSAQGTSFPISTIATFSSGATAQGVLVLSSDVDSTAEWLSGDATTVTVASCGSTVSDERTGTLTFTSSGPEGYDSVSFDLTVSQEANAVVSANLALSAQPAVVPASGGSVQLTPTWEAVYTSGAAIYTDVADTATYEVLDAGGSSAAVSATGEVSFASRGTVEGDVFEASVQVSYSGKTITVTVRQEANSAAVTSVTVTSGSFADTVPAAGGMASLTFVAEAALAFTSGATQTVLNSEQSSLWSASSEVSAAPWVSEDSLSGSGTGTFLVASRGTEVGALRTASVSLTVSFAGVSGSSTFELSQAENKIESAAITISGFGYDIMAAGATESGLPSITESLTYTYSSTATALGEGPLSHAFEIDPPVEGASVSDTGVVTWSENTGDDARSLSVVLTSSVSSGGIVASQTATATLTQTAGTVTYGDVVVSLSYPDIPASGGSVQPVLSYSQTFGYNGSATGGGVITTGGVVSYSGATVPADGSVSAGSLGTTIKDRSEVATVTVTVSLNGKEGSQSSVVYQAANAITSYGTPVVSLSYATVPAGGGAATPVFGFTQAVNYTSGSVGSITEGGSWVFSGGAVDPESGVLQVASLGTTVKGVSSVTTITATVEINGKSGSQQADVLQAANAVSYGDVEVSLSYPDIPASGGSVQPELSYEQDVTYTSGASQTISSGGVVSYSGVGVGQASGDVSAASLGTTLKARTKVTTASVTVSLNGKSGSGSATVYQAANSAESYSVPVVLLSYATILARGGSVSPTVSCTQRATYSSGAQGSVSTAAAVYTYSGDGVAQASGQVTAPSLGVTVTSDLTLITTASVSCSVNGKTGTASAKVYQAINSVEYSDVSVVTFTYASIPAAGGSVSPTVSYRQTATYTSGSTRSITSGGSLSYSGTSVNTTSGAVSAASKGTTISNTTTVTTATVTVTLNGKSGSKSAAVQQSGNYVVGLDIRGGSFSYAGISAGATSAAPTVVGSSVYFIFSSGSESASQPASTYGSYTASVSYTLGSAINGFTAVNSSTGVLTATARGTTIGAARTSGVVSRKVTATWTPTSGYNSAGTKTDTDTKTATCTQALNAVTAVSASTTMSYPDRIPAAGGTSTPELVSSAILTFSSGSKSSGINAGSHYGGTLSVTTSYSIPTTAGFSVNASSGVVTAASRGTTAGAARSVTVTKSLTYTFTNPSSVGSTVVDDDASTTATCTQEANTQSAVYDAPTVTLKVSDIPAAGGTVSSGTVTYSQKWRYSYTSGATSEQTAKTTGGSTSYSAAVSASSLGTTVKSRTAVGTLTATVTMNGKSGSGSATVYQAANSITGFGVPTGRTLTVSDIPASGGTVSSGTLGGSITQTRIYTSGSTDDLTNPTVSASSYSKAVSAPSLGTTVKSRTAVGTLTYYYTCNGKQGSVSATVYQEANAATTISYGSWVITVSSNKYTSSSAACPASGGSATITRSASRTRTQNYTSGATSSLSAETATPTLSISGAGFTLSGTTVTIANRGTTIGAARTATVTATYSGVSKAVTLYQELNTITSLTMMSGIDIPVAANYTAAGGKNTYTMDATYSSGSRAQAGSVFASYIDYSFNQSWGTWTDSSSPYYGSLTVHSREEIIGAARSGVLTGKLIGTINGVSINKSATATITQALNKMTALSIIPTAGATDTTSYPSGNFAASGGTKTPTASSRVVGTFSSGSQAYTGASGAWYGGTLTMSRSWSMATASGFSINTSNGVVTAANRGTTIGAARTCAPKCVISASYTNPASVGSGVVSAAQVTDTFTLTQVANSKSYDYSNLVGHIGSTTWSAKSDYTTFWATGNYTEVYTSGATGASGSGTVPWTSVSFGGAAWISFSSANNTLTWQTNTGAQRSTTITGRVGSWSYPVTVTQRAGSVTGILYVRFPSNTSMGYIPEWRFTVRSSSGGQLWSGTASETGQTGGAYTIRLPDEAVSAINSDTSGSITISCTYGTSGNYYSGSPTGTELDELRSGGTIYVDVS